MEMAEKLNKTPEECKNKWRNLRDNYKKNQNKRKTGSAASVSKYDDERLKFINDSFEESERISSLNAGDEKYSEPSTSSTQMASCEPFLKQTSHEGHSITPNQTQGTSQVKNKKRDSFAEELKKNREDRTKILRQISEQGNSSVHVFFRSMADVVCQFPADKIAQIRTQVCNIVTEIELFILAQRETPSVQDSEHSFNIPQQPMDSNNSQRQIPSPQHSFNVPQQVIHSNNYQRQIPCQQHSFNIPQQVMHTLKPSGALLFVMERQDIAHAYKQVKHPKKSYRQISCPQHSFNIPQQVMHPNNSQRQIPYPQNSFNIPQQVMHPNNSQRQIPCPLHSFNIPQQVMHPKNSQRQIPCPQHSFNIPQQVMHPNNSQRETLSPQHSFNIPQQVMHPNNSQRETPSPQHSFNIPQQVMHPNNSQQETPSPQHSLKHTKTSNARK